MLGKEVKEEFHWFCVQATSLNYRFWSGHTSIFYTWADFEYMIITKTVLLLLLCGAISFCINCQLFGGAYCRSITTSYPRGSIAHILSSPWERVVTFKYQFILPGTLCLRQTYDIFVFYFDNNSNKDKKGRAGRNAQRQTKSIIGLGAGLERASVSFELCYLKTVAREDQRFFRSFPSFGVWHYVI